jgi:PAS domain S-box-containing protein
MSPMRPPFPESDSELGRLIRDFDWSRTALGPLETWPASLKTITGFLLRSPVAMVLLWGKDGVLIYNDAYAVFAGARHPDPLGKIVREAWPEVADFNANVLKVGLAGGTLSYRDQELTLYREGEAEQVWMNLDYSPVIDESGASGGVVAIVVETTERVLADRRMAAEQARQRQLFSQMPGFIGVLTGPEHVYEYVNDAYVAISERGDFVGRPIRHVFPDLAGQGFYELLDQVYATGVPVVTRGMELRLHGSDEVQYIDFVYEPIRDDDGTVTGIFVGGYEVSEAHRAAAALRESEARLLDLNADLERQVIERSSERGTTWQISPFMLSVVDLTTGRFIRVNPTWARVLGYTPDEIAGRSYLEFLHPDDVARTMEGYTQVESGQPVLDFENRYRTKAGDYRWLKWVAVPEGGKLYSTVRDVTAEKAAANERERIFEVSRDLIGVAGFDGYLKSINPAWVAVLDRTKEDLLRTPFSEIIHPDDLAQTGEVVAMLQTGRPVHQFHVRLLRADGKPIPFAWSAVPDADVDGGFFYTVGRDITEEIAAAAELARTQDALRQSQKMEAVGQLTGGIAHDFNNLLAGIAGSLELMQKRVTEQGLAGFDRHLGIAQASTQRAAALTQRLLAFSRRQTLDPKPTDVNRLVNGVEDLFRRSVGPNVDISFIGAIGLWPTKIDAPQLENALLNLVINARDAMPDGGKITIETANKWIDGRTARERDLTPGQYISVCVTDTGTGMTPEVIERAFDPFYTTKPLGQGTGLGLSMIHGFVRQSGGQVRIYSELGQGTTMCLYLPRFAGDLDVDTSAELEEVLEPGHGETVVVIDDEEAIRMLVSDVLEEAGYRILTAADGPSGLKILQSDTRIDLLITDVGLPGGFNGRQVADAARQTRPDLKVLFVTGYADNAVIGNGHLDPGMQVITKPFPMTTLALRVREMIEGLGPAGPV